MATRKLRTTLRAWAWADCEPIAIALDQFIEKWLPALTECQRLVEAFPTVSRSGHLIGPSELLAEITSACREAYGDDLNIPCRSATP